MNIRAVPFGLAPVSIFVGYYGVGKTTVAMNVAIDAARSGSKVTLVDLDIVNPYFRSSEYRELLEDCGVNLIAPVFASAHTSLDVPSLTGAIGPAIERAQLMGDPERSLVVIDAGGDDAGATALGRFAKAITAGSYELFMVVNRYRSIEGDPADAVASLDDVERACRLKSTAIIDNSHLQGETTLDTILEGASYAEKVSQLTGLPIAAITIPEALDRAQAAKSLPDNCLYSVKTYLLPPW